MTHLGGLFRGILLAMVIAIIGVLVPPGRAKAQGFNPDEIVEISASDVRDAFWIANAIDQTDGQNGYEMMAFNLVLQHLYRETPALPAETAVQQIQELQKIYQSQTNRNSFAGIKTGGENVLDILTALTNTVPTHPTSRAVFAATQEVYTKTLSQPLTVFATSQQRLVGLADLQQSVKTIAGASREVYSQAVDLSKEAQGFGKAFDALWSDDLSASIYADSPTLIRNSPTLQRLNTVVSLIDSSGRVLVKAGALVDLVQKQLGKLNVVASNARGTMAVIDKIQKEAGNLVDGLYNPDAMKKAKDAGDKALKDLEPQFNGARAGLGVLTKFVGFFDKDLAVDIEKIGGATIRIAEAGVKFIGAIASLAAGAAFPPLGVITLVGSLVGAVAEVFDIFGDASEASPPPDQIIIDQITLLRQEVQDLRKEMHGRFDRIDQALTKIYDEMTARFDKIDVVLANIDQNVEVVKTTVSEVQSTLHAQQRQLTVLEHNLLAAVEAVAQQDFWKDVNATMPYRGRAPEIVDLASYSKFENSFHSYATLHSRNAAALLNAPSDAEYNDDEWVANNLADGTGQLRSVDSYINFLRLLPAKRSGWSLPKLSDEELANPRRYAIATRAWTQLTLDYPSYAAEIDAREPDRRENIVKPGRDLADALRAISTMGNSRPNTALFDKLIENYTQRLADAKAELDKAEPVYHDWLKGELKRTTKINVFDGASQEIHPNDLPAGFGVMSRCNSGTEHLEGPRGAANALLPSQHKMAAYFALGQFDLCYTTRTALAYRMERFCEVFIEEIHRCVSWGQRPVCNSNNLYMEIAGRYNGGVVGRHTRQVGSSACNTSPILDWVAHKPGFEQDFATPRSYADVNAGANIAPVIEARLGELQLLMYSWIAGKLQNGGIAELSLASKRLTGARVLLDAYITLGLPRAMESNEYLRSFLRGSERLFDQNQLAQFYLLYATKQKPRPTTSVTGQIVPLMNERLKDFYHKQDDGSRHGMLMDHLNAAARSNGETQRLLATSLAAVRLAGAQINTPVASIASTNTNFGTRPLASVTPVTLSLENSGLGKNVSVKAVRVEGPQATAFTTTTSCGSTGAMLAPGTTCPVTVTFRPTSPGRHTATLTVETSSVGPAFKIPLLGVASESANYGVYLPFTITSVR